MIRIFNKIIKKILNIILCTVNKLNDDILLKFLIYDMPS